METLLQDLKYGVRMLARAPGFTFIAVLTLALGIGANTAIFSVINATLLASLPYSQPERVVMVWEHHPSRGFPHNVVSPGNFLHWRDANTVFEEMAAFVDLRANLTGDSAPEQVPGQVVTPNLFSLLGVKTELGRTFAPEEGELGNDDVVVLSHGLWQRRFGGSHWPHPELVYNSMTLVVRSKADPVRLTGSIRAIVQSIDPDLPVSEVRTMEQWLSDSVAQARFNTLLLGIFSAVALLLAVIGIYGVMSATITERTHEIGIRMALGAMPRDIWRQTLVAGAVITLVGLSAGFAASLMLTRLLASRCSM
jgi:hypothetical protein